MSKVVAIDQRWGEFFDMAISQGLTRAEAVLWADDQTRPKADPFSGALKATPLLWDEEELPRNFYKGQGHA